MNTVIPMLVSTIAGLSTLIGATTIFFKVDLNISAFMECPNQLFYLLLLS